MHQPNTTTVFILSFSTQILSFVTDRWAVIGQTFGNGYYPMWLYFHTNLALLYYAQDSNSSNFHLVVSSHTFEKRVTDTETSMSNWFFWNEEISKRGELSRKTLEIFAKPSCLYQKRTKKDFVIFILPYVYFYSITAN